MVNHTGIVSIDKNLLQICHAMPSVSERMEQEICLPVARKLSDQTYINNRFNQLLDGRECVVKRDGLIINKDFGDYNTPRIYNAISSTFQEEARSADGRYTIACSHLDEAGMGGVLKWGVRLALPSAGWVWREKLTEIISLLAKYAAKNNLPFAIDGEESFTPAESEGVDVTKEPNTNNPDFDLIPHAALDLDSEGDLSSNSVDRETLRRVIKRGGDRHSTDPRRRSPEECDNRNIPAFTDVRGRLPEDALSAFNELQQTPYIAPYMQGVHGVLRLIYSDALDFMPHPVRVYLKDPSTSMRVATTFRQVPLLYGLSQFTSDEIKATHLMYSAQGTNDKHILIFVESDDCEIIGSLYMILRYVRFNDGHDYPVLTNVRAFKFSAETLIGARGYKRIQPSENMRSKISIASYAIRLLAIEYHDKFNHLIKSGDTQTNREVTDNILDDLLLSYRKYLGIDPDIPCNQAGPFLRDADIDYPDVPRNYNVSTCEVDLVTKDKLNGYRLP